MRPLIIRIIEYFFVLSFLVTSCGTQKAANQVTSDELLIQDEFFGVSWGTSFRKARTRLQFNVQPRYSISTEGNNKILIRDATFAGCNWAFIEFDFVDNFMSLVSFSQNCTTKEAAEVMKQSVYERLNRKYHHFEQRIIEGGYCFRDSEGSLVSITTKYAESKGGKFFWYCDLSYAWIGGMLLYDYKVNSEI